LLKPIRNQFIDIFYKKELSFSTRITLTNHTRELELQTSPSECSSDHSRIEDSLIWSSTGNISTTSLTLKERNTSLNISDLLKTSSHWPGSNILSYCRADEKRQYEHIVEDKGRRVKRERRDDAPRGGRGGRR